VAIQCYNLLTEYCVVINNDTMLQFLTEYCAVMDGDTMLHAAREILRRNGWRHNATHSILRRWC
jgi:hypothetical protein